jgi:death-on-curing protein
MASAYLFHFSRNRPFYAANDRTAIAAALVFLRMNGQDLHADAREFHDLLNAVVQHKADKEIVAWFLRSHASASQESPFPEMAGDTTAASDPD